MPVTPLALKTAEIASHDVGQMEIPHASNRGQRIDQYQIYTGLLAPGTPLYDGSGRLIAGFAYCASACSLWVFEAKVGLNLGIPPAFRKSGSALHLWANNPSLQFTQLTAEDLPCIGINQDSDAIHGHAFVCVGLDDSTGLIQTIDPNSDPNGSREGLGVFALNRRNVNDSNRLGYLRIA